MKDKIKILGMNNDMLLECESKEDAVDVIINEYKVNDVCVGELMDGLTIHGLSMQDVVDVFAAVMFKLEGDQIVQFTEDEQVNRWEW